jgi:hypothetical protein
MPERMTLEGIRDPKLRRLLIYWQERCRGRFAPARQEIDPVDLGWILADLAVVDVTYDPLRFRFRLVGSSLEARRPLRWQGTYVDELPALGLRQLLTQSYSRVVERRAPMHGFRDAVIDERTLKSEYLVMPLSTEGAVIDALLVAVKFAR